MKIKKCEHCDWIPYVLYITDEIWGNTIGHYVFCPNCYRQGKMKPTRSEAIEEWNMNGYNEVGIMK